MEKSAEAETGYHTVEKYGDHWFRQERPGSAVNRDGKVHGEQRESFPANDGDGGDGDGSGSMTTGMAVNER